MIELLRTGTNQAWLVFQEFTPTQKRFVLLRLLLGLIGSLLDVLGIVFFGLLVSLAVSSINFKEVEGITGLALRTLRINNLSLEFQVVSLATLFALLLGLKSYLALKVLRDLSFLLGTIGKNVTGEVFQKLLVSNLNLLGRFNKQEWISAITKGVNVLYVRFPFAVLSIIIEVFLLLVTLVVLLLINPLIASIAFSFFGALIVLTTIRQQNQSRKLTQEDYILEVKASQFMSESIEGIEELQLNSNIKDRVSQLVVLKDRQLFAQASIMMLPLKYKYFFEAALIISFILVAGIAYILFDAVQASAAFALFVGASLRIGPSMLRLQQASLLIRNGWPYISLFRRIEKELGSIKSNEIDNSVISKRIRSQFSVRLKGVDVTYPSRGIVLRNVNLELENGERLALIGPSGGGKTTLLKVIAGLIPVSGGEILFNGKPMIDQRLNRKLTVGYVPQNVITFSGSIRDNIVLGRHLSDEDVWSALAKADLLEFVKALNKSLDTNVGELADRLSGGQKQRLGIARALISRPNILLLDEFTSALDKESDLKITDTVKNLPQDLCIVAASHRASTVESFSRLLYVERGKVSPVSPK